MKTKLLVALTVAGLASAVFASDQKTAQSSDRKSSAPTAEQDGKVPVATADSQTVTAPAKEVVDEKACDNAAKAEGKPGSEEFRAAHESMLKMLDKLPWISLPECWWSRNPHGASETRTAENLQAKGSGEDPEG